jgi:hypothetical protein
MVPCALRALCERHVVTAGVILTHPIQLSSHSTIEKIMNHQHTFDPTYVQVSKADAADILGISIQELDRRRESDDRCPNGFRDWETFPPVTRFRLSDIYAYSEVVMTQAQQASTALLISQP